MRESLNTFAGLLAAMLAALANFIKAAYRSAVAYVKPRLTFNFGAIKRLTNAGAMLMQAAGFSIKRVSALAMFLLIAAVTAHAQDTGGIDLTSPETLIGSIEWLYGALVVVGGYLSSFIPFFNRIDKGVYRVLAWAALVGVGFVTFGFSDIFSLAITYAMSTSLYEVILKWIIKSPKPDTAGG